MRPGYKVTHFDDASCNGESQLFVQQIFNALVRVCDEEDLAGLTLDVARGEKVIVCEGVDGGVDVLGLIVVVVVDRRERDEARSQQYLGLVGKADTGDAILLHHIWVEMEESGIVAHDLGQLTSAIARYTVLTYEPWAEQRGCERKMKDNM